MGDDVGECGLAESRRAVEEDVLDGVGTVLEAWMAMRRRSMRSAWPMYSSMRVGRSDQLICSSSGASVVGEMRRSVAMEGV